MDHPYAEPFLATGSITEVVRPIRGGKEASVYLCRTPEGLAALKVYTPRAQRRFKNAEMYMEGAFIGDPRVERALRRKTGFGRLAGQAIWVSREFAALSAMYDAGVSVPQPYEILGDAILMEYLGDEDEAAPHLRHVTLTADEAAEAFRWLVYDIELMLAANLVHGDLSPYNILWWEGRARIIDLPQAVDPRLNRFGEGNLRARTLFERDVRNVCAYFARAGLDVDPVALADDIWERFERAAL